jgi:hypothetical protein
LVGVRVAGSGWRREALKMFSSNEYPEIYDDLQRCIDDLITGKNKTVFDMVN